MKDFLPIHLPFLFGHLFLYNISLPQAFGRQFWIVGIN
jgi:hypothetical protein